VTHGALDHVGQALAILERSRARLVCDMATRISALEHRIPADRIYPMVPGVELEFDGLRVKALLAHHISYRQLANGAYFSAPPLSYVITTPGAVRFFCGGDTSISTDHRLYGTLYKPQVAFLGVGGANLHGQSFTELYPKEAALVAKWLGVRIAIPIHYRGDEATQFARALRQQAPRVKLLVMRPGDTCQVGSARRRALRHAGSKARI
jgi:L-ascorbate metabolism protein UlaG (beta-lactamase superfamily)